MNDEIEAAERELERLDAERERLHHEWSVASDRVREQGYERPVLIEFPPETRLWELPAVGHTCNVVAVAKRKA